MIKDFFAAIKVIRLLFLQEFGILKVKKPPPPYDDNFVKSIESTFESLICEFSLELKKSENSIELINDYVEIQFFKQRYEPLSISILVTHTLDQINPTNWAKIINGASINYPVYLPNDNTEQTIYRHLELYAKLIRENCSELLKGSLDKINKYKEGYQYEDYL